MKVLFSSALIATAFMGTAAQAAQALVPAQSAVNFEAKQMGVPLKGHFKKFDAQIAFDAAKPESSKIHFTVDTSSAVKALGGGKFQVDGTLTIKGNAQKVSLPVTLTQSGATTTAAGTLALKRLNFKIGDGDWKDTSMVADEVNVQFKLALTGVGKL